MIRRVMRTQTAVPIVLAILGGCMPAPGGRGISPTTLVVHPPTTTVSTQPAIVAASINPPGLKPIDLASTRGAPTRAAENPSSQPADLAALADRAGGPGGGLIVGAIRSALQADSIERAKHANDQAEQHPAQVADVPAHASADLNDDGFITLDEITAMKRAGLTEQELLDRLRQSQAVFSASLRQQQYLRDRGVPDAVVNFIAEPGPTTR